MKHGQWSGGSTAVAEPDPAPADSTPSGPEAAAIIKPPDTPAVTPFTLPAGPFNAVRVELQRAPIGTIGYIKIINLTMDTANAYPAGGFLIPGEVQGLIWGADPISYVSSAAAAYAPSFNYTSQLMQIFSGTTEFSGTFAANITFRITVWSF